VEGTLLEIFLFNILYDHQAYFSNCIYCLFGFNGLHENEQKKKVVFLGDSITQLGLQANGYITQIQALIKQEDVEQKYQLLSAGVNGSTTLNLKERLQK
jgi:lysophospholipase L1-like esterase